MGDFNLNILKPDHTIHNLFKFLKNLHLTQSVNEVTRPISGPCLDHLWVSHPDRIAAVEVKSSGLSDHLPITALRKYRNESKVDKEHKSLKYRDFKRLDTQGFVQSLRHWTQHLYSVILMIFMTLGSKFFLVSLTTLHQ